MQITDIKIRKFINEGRLRGVVSITLDNLLAIHDIKIVQGDERLFVAMPSRRDENGVYRDIVHPVSSASRAALEGSILAEYKERLSQLESDSDFHQS